MSEPIENKLDNSYNSAEGIIILQAMLREAEHAVKALVAQEDGRTV